MEEREPETGEPDRRSDTLRRMIAGAAFAAPVVTSFSLDGMGITPASAQGAVASPWTFEGSGVRNPAGYGAFSACGGTGRIFQITGNYGSVLAAGAVGVHVSLRVRGSVRSTVQVPGSLDVTEVFSPGAVAQVFERDHLFASPTTEDLSVTVVLAKVTAQNGEIDDVSVRGWYP